MRKLLLLVLILFAAATAHAQSTSRSWIDVTASPYGAKNDCSADAGPAINSAIAGAPTGSGVIFFPTGCYLIKTQIVDTNSSAWLTYVADGNVQLQASSATPPSNSLIQFGNNSTTVTARKIQNLYFNCNGASIDGIDVDGLSDSEFDKVSIYACHGTAHMRTVGTNGSNWSNKFFGGLIESDGSGGNGVQLGTNSGANANSWSFYGTQILGNGSSGVGIEFEGFGGGFYGGDVEKWSTGIGIAINNPNSGSPAQIGGFGISGNYIENNSSFGVRVGYEGYAGMKAAGVSITGNYINCNNLSNTIGVWLDQASGFSVASNHLRQCTTWAIKGESDATNRGADNGFVGANFIDGGQSILLQGSNNTTSSSISTKSAAYALSGADSWVNVTGNTVITVPHAMIGTRWDVFNAGSGNVSLVCDTGTINGYASLPVASQTGRTVMTDGTNCFAH